MAVYSVLDLLGAATTTFMGHMGSPGYFEAVAELYAHTSVLLQLMAWPFSPPGTAPARPTTCTPCAGLIMLLWVHLAFLLVCTYGYYMWDWKLRRRFLRNTQHELLVPEQVERLCDTPLARLLLDGHYGRAEAVMCHAALVVLQIWLSWGLAHLLALRVMPALLAPSHMELLCPLAPRTCTTCPWL
jgi:hypothetical protein